jgi:hypothetical protein
MIPTGDVTLVQERCKFDTWDEYRGRIIGHNAEIVVVDSITIEPQT